MIDKSRHPESLLDNPEQADIQKRPSATAHQIINSLLQSILYVQECKLSALGYG